MRFERCNLSVSRAKYLVTTAMTKLGLSRTLPVRVVILSLLPALALQVLLPTAAQARTNTYSVLANESENDKQPPTGVLLAQSDGDDAYDPFADYSEFEESMDEEEDINFFRNGRLLTMGFLIGYRGWTQTLGQIYSGSPSFGLFLTYFFDLRFALQFGYVTSDHTLMIPARNGADAIQGTIGFTDISVNMKYFFNTQNVTRGLADLNPYLLTGFSQTYRTAVISQATQFAKDSAFGFDIGAGIEIPMMRNKMYFGGQAMYQIVNFADEGRVIQDANEKSTGISPRGDTWSVLGVIGVNF